MGLGFSCLGLKFQGVGWKPQPSVIQKARPSLTEDIRLFSFRYAESPKWVLCIDFRAQSGDDI